MLYRYAASKGYDTAPDSVEIQNFATMMLFPNMRKKLWFGLWMPEL